MSWTGGSPGPTSPYHRPSYDVNQNPINERSVSRQDRHSASKIPTNHASTTLHSLTLQTMDSIEGQLPIYAAQDKPIHIAVITPSLRRRRLIGSTLTFVSVAVLLLWVYHTLFGPIQPDTVTFQDLNEGTHPAPLGLEADLVYHLGSLSATHYRTSLENFIITAFPKRLQPKLSTQLHQYLEFNSSKSLPITPKIIWQTNDVFPENTPAKSWATVNPDYDYRFLSDDDVEEWVNKTFKGSIIEWTWKHLDLTVMKVDFLRYLVLLVEGGIYSDIDTTCLRQAKKWGSDPDVQGLVRGEEPSAIVGIEADVGDRADWHDWWSRPIQIVQWTMAFSPGHPILLDTIHRIYTKTLANEPLYRPGNTPKPEGKALENAVLEWTGPAVFTDATLRYLKIESDLNWRDLRELRKPLRAGSVTILPVTGFSPDVGNFGAGFSSDEQAMVRHDFKGSWKHAQR